MLKRSVTVLVSLMFAAICAATGYVSYSMSVIWLERIHFFNYHSPLARLLCTIVALAIAIGVYTRARNIASALFLGGVIGLLGATLHDCFISWGLFYHWFQVSGADGWVFRGFFEPEENPLLVLLDRFFRTMLLLAYVGIFLLTAQFALKHLTRRWSHEAWRVVQRERGAVKPTTQTNGVPVNDEGGLEREADAMARTARRKDPGKNR